MWDFFSQAKVVCVGSVCQDIFLPTGAGEFVETPEDILAPHKIQFALGAKVAIEDRFDDIGGVAANVAVGLTRLGIKTSIVSRVGDDDLGVRIIERLKKEGVDIHSLIRLPQTHSDLSAILVFTQTGERTIFHNRDSNEQLKVVEADLRGAEWVFVSALNGAWQANLETVLAAKKQYGFRIAINPGQHNLKTDVELMKRVIREADILTLNHDEALFLLGTEYASRTEDEIMKALHDLGPRFIGLTDGARGAWASSADGSVFSIVPPHIEKVKDSTGAGDAFTSGFFAALLHEETIEIALHWGMRNSISVIQEYGATKALLIEPVIRA